MSSSIQKLRNVTGQGDRKRCKILSDIYLQEKDSLWRSMLPDGKIT
jgi:hypothetical protein